MLCPVIRRSCDASGELLLQICSEFYASYLRWCMSQSCITSEGGGSMIRLLSGIQETLYLLRSENRRPRDWLDEILVVLGVGAALITISFSGHSGSFSLSRFALPLVIMPIVGAISMLLVTLTRRRTR